MTGFSRLRELAEAAAEGNPSDLGAYLAFIAAADPQTVVALLDALERTQADAAADAHANQRDMAALRRNPEAFLSALGPVRITRWLIDNGHADPAIAHYVYCLEDTEGD